MKRAILNIVRVVISAGLLIYLIYLADFDKIITTLSNMSPAAALIAMAAFMVTVAILSLRWYLLVRAHALPVTFGKLFIYYMIGFFFNNFLPTSIGGDVSRAVYLSQQTGTRAVSLGTVFLERVIGLLATLSLAGVSLFWLIGHADNQNIIYLLAVLALILAGGMAVLLSRRLYQRLTSLLGMLTFFDLGNRISKVFDSLHYYRDKKRVLLGAWVCSLGSQFMLIVMNYVLALGLNIREVSFGYFFLVVPVTFIISLLPSINGLGVRDWGYQLLLLGQGVARAKIISLSFMVISVPILMSMIGGAFLLIYRQRGVKTPILGEEKL
ncbi:MAG: lysylphosphatidylglycerol synthase transmembrane domain-containing protein [Calditrichia bacterium]